VGHEGDAALRPGIWIANQPTMKKRAGRYTSRTKNTITTAVRTRACGKRTR
jgi:hypothetical protein